MSPQDDHVYRRLLRETFREAIKLVLGKEGPLETYQIYNQVRMLHPELCDDDIECISGGEPEWKKQVRFAQQDLKASHEIERADRRWRIGRTV